MNLLMFIDQKGNPLIDIRGIRTEKQQQDIIRGQRTTVKIGKAMFKLKKKSK